MKRRQQVLKPRDSPEITDTLKPSLSAKRGQHRRDRQIGEGSSIRPGSWNEAKAQDGSPGNLGDPAHVHVRARRQSGRRLSSDPGPEGSPPSFRENLPPSFTEQNGSPLCADIQFYFGGEAAGNQPRRS